MHIPWTIEAINVDIFLCVLTTLNSHSSVDYHLEICVAMTLY